ncbi:MAG: lysophospholipid acyltransferase family protein [Acidobacteria bacterium]|nr:lysophospholipid acyltransferase family protein [Acidobacteriota bacterium]MCI0722834.1 lysophospholipid acyltransferase family protein [Acidobacteriota bacterium]
MKLEYYAAVTVVKLLGMLPRNAALALGQVAAWTAFLLSKRLRAIAEWNLKLALPEMGHAEREQIVRGVFSNLGRLLAEFCQLPKLTAQNVSQRVIYDGYENFAAALQRGQGLLFLTAHYGAWELCPYAHALYGHPLKFVVRPIDNPLIDRLVNRYRMLSGNQIIQKKNSLKEILVTLKRGAAVGILIDQNTTRDAGVFAPFFNIPACTTTSLATIALRTGAAIVPGVLIWDERLRKHRLRFEPPVALMQTGNKQQDIVNNTALCNQVLEELVRKHPDQWLWVHRRWKTRPEGEKELY